MDYNIYIYIITLDLLLPIKTDRSQSLRTGVKAEKQRRKSDRLGCSTVRTKYNIIIKHVTTRHVK